MTGFGGVYLTMIDVRFLKTALRDFLRNEQSPTFLEYGLLVSLIALIALAGVTLFGLSVRDIYADINNNIPP